MQGSHNRGIVGIQLNHGVGLAGHHGHRGVNAQGLTRIDFEGAGSLQRGATLHIGVGTDRVAQVGIGRANVQRTGTPSGIDHLQGIAHSHGHVGQSCQVAAELRVSAGRQTHFGRGDP